MDLERQLYFESLSYIPLRVSFLRPMVQNFVLISNHKIGGYILPKIWGGFGLQKSRQYLQCYGGYEIEANNLEV